MTRPLRQEVEIVNRRGLHARASARFVKCAAGFNATVCVSRNGHTVPGTSIMGLMMLAAGPGARLVLEATGPEAAAALAALTALVTAQFDEGRGALR